MQDQRPRRLFTLGLGLFKIGDSFMAFQPLQVAIAQLRPTRPKGQELGIAQALLLGHGLGQGIELGTAVVPTYPRHPMMLAAQSLTASALRVRA